MTAISFDSAALLAEYVTDNTIVAADIIQIVESAGRWYLFHY